MYLNLSDFKLQISEQPDLGGVKVKSEQGLDPSPNIEPNHQSSNRTKDEILNLTRQCMAKHGRRATTLRMVAEAVGITAAAITNHFGTKDNLVRETYIYVMNQERRRLENPIARLSKSVTDANSFSRLLWSELCSGSPSEKNSSLIWLQLQFETYRGDLKNLDVFKTWHDQKFEFWRNVFMSHTDCPKQAARLCTAFLDAELLFFPDNGLHTFRSLLMAERCTKFAQVLWPTSGESSDSDTVFERFQKEHETKTFEKISTHENIHYSEIELVILNASLDIIASQGVDRLTHRRIAKAAHISLSSTTYYFKSIDDILDHAFLFLYRNIISDVSPQFFAGQDMDKTPREMIVRTVNINFKSDLTVRNKIRTLQILIFEVSRTSRFQNMISDITFSRGLLTRISLQSMDIPELSNTSRFDASIFDTIVTGLMPSQNILETPVMEIERDLTWVFERLFLSDLD